jgi:hypothetical protein
MRDHNELDRQSEGIGLVLDQSTPDAVHRNAVVGLTDAGNELDDLQVPVSVANVVESEGAVFAAAPEDGGLLLNVHEKDSRSWP